MLSEADPVHYYQLLLMAVGRDKCGTISRQKPDAPEVLPTSSTARKAQVGLLPCKIMAYDPPPLSGPAGQVYHGCTWVALLCVQASSYPFTQQRAA